MTARAERERLADRSEGDVWRALIPGYDELCDELRRRDHRCDHECKPISDARGACCCSTYPCPMHEGSWEATT